MAFRVRQETGNSLDGISRIWLAVHYSWAAFRSFRTLPQILSLILWAGRWTYDHCQKVIGRPPYCYRFNVWSRIVKKKGPGPGYGDAQNIYTYCQERQAIKLPLWTLRSTVCIFYGTLTPSLVPCPHLSSAAHSFEM